MVSQVKFAEVLTEVINSSKYRGLRKIFTDQLGISTSRLSQYERRQGRPSFEVLINMAELLDVSLDYLVFGREAMPRDPDIGPIARYIDQRFNALAHKEDLRTETLSRIEGELGRRIDDVVRSIVEAIPATSAAGLLHDDEILELESHSIETWILSTNLNDEAIQLPSGEFAVGRFFNVIANNLARGRKYRLLVPESYEKNWAPMVARYVALLKERVRPDILAENCGIRITRQPIATGCAFYKFELDDLKRNHPNLFQRISGAVDSSGWIGNAITPANELQVDVRMDLEHLAHARPAYNAIWKDATVLYPEGRIAVPPPKQRRPAKKVRPSRIR